MNCGGCVAGYCQAKCEKVKRTNNTTPIKKQEEFLNVKRMTKEQLESYGL